MELQDCFLGLLSIFLLDGKELYSIPSPVALHPFWWQTEWSFQKAKLIQSSFHWKLCYFFPLVLKLEIISFFFHGYRGLLWSGLQWLAHTPSPLCCLLPAWCFLALCCLWGMPLPKPFAHCVCYAGSSDFFQTCHGFGLTLACVITVWCLCLSRCCEVWVPVLLMMVTPGPDTWLGLSEGVYEWMNASRKRCLLTRIWMDEQHFIIE